MKWRFDDPRLLDDARAVLADEDTVTPEIQTASGRWYRRRVLPYRAQGDRIDGAVVTFKDVTEIKTAREDAESIIDAIAQPLLVLDSDLKVVCANRAYHEMFRSCPRRTGGQPIEELDDGRWHRRDLLNGLRDLARGGEAFEAVEVIQELPNLGLRTLVLDGRPIRRHGPARRHLTLLTITDVTPSKVADAKLRLESKLVMELTRQKSFLQSLIETAQTAILLLDVDGRITLVNPYLEEISGFRSDEVLGKDWFSTFLPDERRAPTRALFHRVMSRRFNAGHTNTILTKDGRLRHITWQAKTITDDEGRVIGLLNTGHDVTERQQMEAKHEEAFRRLEERFEERTRELDRRREELDRIGKLDALGRLTGSLAHDFSNLLTVILGNLEMMQQRVGEDEESRHAIEQAREAAEIGGQLTDQLLAFGRRRSLATEPVDLHEAVSGVVELLQRALGDKVNAVTDLAADLPMAQVDPAQLRSALLNLAINARDAMPDGGTITIAARLEDVDVTRARSFGDVRPGRYVALAVVDTGIGMTADTRQRAFEPFFTAKEAGTGTGLGLSMVYGFARQSGGHATLDSEPGQGTTVTLYLPLTEDSREAELADVASDGPVSAPVKCVLVVEDEEQVRRVAVSRLERLGYRVLEAADADAAVAILEQRPTIDLVFSDIVMPGNRTVADVVAAARAHKPDIGVLLTTGHRQHHLLDGLEAAGAFTLLRKPYVEATLARTVRRLLDG